MPERRFRILEKSGVPYITCTFSCDGKGSDTNSKGLEVCAIFGAPAQEPNTYVCRFTHQDEMRVCELLNPDFPSTKEELSQK